MSAISLINSGVAWFTAAAVLAFLFSFHKSLSGWIAGVGGAVGSLCTAAAGFTVLTNALAVSGVMPFIGHSLQITPLNAIWLITLGLCGLFVSLYNIDWHRHPQVKANGLLVNLLMAAAVCAVVASNLGTLVVMAEIMALCAVFLTGCSKEGKLWFALGRIGTLLLAVACYLVWQRYGTLELRLLDLRTQELPLGSDIWLLGVAGFGLLAGIIPLHGWVPQAHANASAPAAALFSTVVMKVGLLGILSLSLLGGNAPLWWGITLLVLGMITAFVGGLYALMEHNIQRLLAYHTLENIGIILLGLGAGVTGISLNQPALIALGLTGGLYHLVNHSLFKSVLFLGAGSIWFRTGHRDIEKLGGIGKRMPVISLAMLVGLMAMAALPPLSAMDACLCMGASIGMAGGAERAQGKDFSRGTVAVLGDSTFIHSGITSLIDAVYNRETITVVILDNRITGMTGHQQNPATGFDIHNQPAPQLNLEKLVESCGVTDVRVVDPFDLKATEQAIREAAASEQVSVVIARRPCALLDKTVRPAFVIDGCRGCGACMKLSCPAIERHGKLVEINPALCSGCGMCAQVCPFKAIKSGREENV